MIDELTILLNSFLEDDTDEGPQNVKFFLNWLRNFRQQSGSNIHWVFCSSVGIENFANLHGLNYTLNDVEPFPIGAFAPQKAKELFNALAQSENLEFPSELVDYTLEKISWHLPYFIQILFFNINQLITIYDHPISKETIDDAYNNLIEDKHLNTWDERLKEYYLLEQNARLLLTGLSKAKEGESRALLLSRLSSKITDTDKADLTLSRLLNMLKNDGYLDITSEDKYVFRSPLLRDFWYNRFAR
ncbi:MAG: hypothetical protein ACJAT4_000109 [Granulosicoccus sp.]|jgi:hypothetical protein